MARNQYQSNISTDPIIDISDIWRYSMEKKVYEELKRIQNTHWWFVAKREIVLDIFKNYVNGRDNKILDVGCGMGLMLQHLKKHGEVFGMDFSKEAVQYCQNTFGKDNIKYGKLPDNVPFDNGFFDAVVALDVLEHIEDDLSSISKLYDILKDNGICLCTVPALDCLWSYNDIAVHHKRRYSKKELISKFEHCGFKINMCSYYNFYLFIPIFLIRKFKNILKIQKDDMSDNVKDNVVNRILYKIFSSERRHLKKGGYPIGVSIILVAAKEKNICHA